jgi:hypothetical protein
VARKLEIQIVGDTKDLERALGRASKETESFGSKLSGMAKTAGIAAGAAALGGLVVAGEKFAEAATKAQEETGKLDQAFKNAGVSADKMRGFVDRTEASQRKLGFTNSDTRDALTKFVTAGDNTSAALKDLGLASDYARFKGISLADASLVLVRAHAGNMRALKSLGLSMQPVTVAMDALKEAHKKSKTPIEEWERALAKSTDATATYETVTAKMQKVIGGQAEEFSKSAKGGMEAFHAQLMALEEQAGKHLLPAITSVTKVLADLMAIFSGAGSVTDKFTKALERLGVSAETSKQIVMGFKDAFAVIIPVAQLVIKLFEGMVLVVTTPLRVIIDLIHGDWKQACDDLFKPVLFAVNLIGDTVKKLAGVAWDAFSGTFQNVFVGPFTTAWTTVANWFDSAAGFVAKVAGFIGGLPKKAWDEFVSLFEKIFVAPFKIAWDGVSDWVSDWVGKVAGYVDELPSKIKDFGGELLKRISGFVTNSGIAKFLTDKVVDFANFFESLPGKIGDALSRGVKGALGQIKSWFSDLFGWLPGWAKDILGIHSPSKVFEDIGEHIVAGLIKGLGNMAGALKKKVESVVGAPIDWAAKVISTISDLFTGGAVGTANGSIQLPASFTPTHETMGLPGFPAIDVMAPGGTVALSPAAGTIVKESGRPFSQGWSNGPGSAIGLSTYLLSRAGEYFMTHFSSLYAGEGATVAHGTPLGVVGPMDDFGVAAHIHEGFHAFAKGGIVTRPTFGLVGEAGPEAVIPLDRMGGATVNVYVAGSVVTENQLVDAVYSGLLRKQARNVSLSFT